MVGKQTHFTYFVLLGLGQRCEFTVTIYSAWLEFPPTSWRVFGGSVVSSSETVLSKRAYVSAVSQVDSLGHNGESPCMTLESLTK